MCIRIGWAKCDITPNSLVFGISNVECSVSGQFYKHLPLVSILYPPDVVLSECHISDSVPVTVPHKTSCNSIAPFNKRYMFYF
jgi:hypothetical protein